MRSRRRQLRTRLNPASCKRRVFGLPWQALFHRHILCRPKLPSNQTGAMVSSAQPTLDSANSDVQAESLPLLSLTVLVPVFNDWQAVAHLVERLDSVFGEHAFSGHLLLIDDGSLEELPEDFPKIPPRHIQQIQCVELRTNLGHQRALCVGLVHLRQSSAAAPVVIMDADGEDSPSDIPRLLEKFVGEGKREVIFAA